LAGYVAGWSPRSDEQVRTAIEWRVHAHNLLVRVRKIDETARHRFRTESPEGIHSRSAAWLLDISDATARAAFPAAELAACRLDNFVTAAQERNMLTPGATLTEDMIEQLWLRTAPTTTKAMPAGTIPPPADGVGLPQTVAEQQMPEPTGSTTVTWQEASDKMERLRSQGERWPGSREMAKRIGCSSATVSKAVNNTPSLKAWANAGAQNRTAPRDQGMTDVITDRTPQRRELDPSEEVAISEYLQGDLTPQERAWFHSMSSEDQLNFLNDPDREPKIRWWGP
jgi:hypothetical protein